MLDLRRELGDIDIYLLDQILRGRVASTARILDAGCGGGRNLQYFWRQGHVVWGIEPDEGAFLRARQNAIRHGGKGAEERILLATLDDARLPEGPFDLVICNAVLHFARDLDHFESMLRALVGFARPGGIGFVRLATSVGMEDLIHPVTDLPPGWALLPDGTRRFLVDLERLCRLTESWGLELLDPIKTVNVHALRAMTTWVWRA